MHVVEYEFAFNHKRMTINWLGIRKCIKWPMVGLIFLCIYEVFFRALFCENSVSLGT